ncbi:MAG TPA: 4a-hydroxytetrahydrobiopterin dehydratase [Oligoflexia bacterium]|nr:4a-hydroxytetrahydrobiopterin dehydratase [Oligoflexia bacterium]
MENLSEMKCVPCRGGVPPLEEARRIQLHAQIDNWCEVDGHHLSKTFSFGDFRAALAWVNKVGELAEEVGHHPDVYLSWGKVRLDIWTHKIDNLTESDFIFAAKVDALHTEADV